MHSSCEPRLLSDEELRKLTKPIAVPHDLLCSAVSASYGEGVKVIKQLDSYDDCNFLIEINDTKYLLKIHNGVESADYIEARGESKIDFANSLYRQVMRSNILQTNIIYPVQYRTTIHTARTSILRRSGQEDETSLLSSPKSATTSCFEVKKGDDVALYEFPVSSPLYSPCILAMQVLSWVEGTTMSSTRALPIQTIADAGVLLGKLCQLLDDYPDPIPKAAYRYHAWDTKNIADLRNFTHCIQDEHRQAMVENVIDAFQNQILPCSHNFRGGIIHGDFNDANILLDGSYNVTGVIDFGDSVYSWRIVDLSVGMAYAMLSTFGKTKHSLAAAAAMLRGFHSVYSVTDDEKKHLRLLIACRLALSCTYGAFSLQQNPDNLYLLLHSEPAWTAMELIWGDGCDAASVDELFDLALCKLPVDTTTDMQGTANVVDCSNICIPDPSVYDVLRDSRIQTLE